MARIRTVKPEHWNDKELATISLQAHLLWIGMWNFSDDDGIIEADPLLLRSQIFPRRTDVRTEQIEQWIGQLVKARFVIPFEYNGSGYYIHRTFKTHQKIDKPKPSKVPKDVISNILSKIEFDNPEIPRRIPDESATSRRPVVPVVESKGEDSNSRGGEKRPPDENTVIWDIEAYLLDEKYRRDYEVLAMEADKKSISEIDFKELIQKYHLFCQEHDDYPKKPIQLMAGIRKWILNEKRFKNGTNSGSMAGTSEQKLGTSAARIKTAKEW